MTTQLFLFPLFDSILIISHDLYERKLLSSYYLYNYQLFIQLVDWGGVEVNCHLKFIITFCQTAKISSVVIVFRDHKEGWLWLKTICEQFKLCTDGYNLHRALFKSHKINITYTSVLDYNTSYRYALFHFYVAQY